MKKLKKMFRNDKEALKEIDKLDRKICDVILLLYNVEDKIDFKCEELDIAIKLLQKL